MPFNVIIGWLRRRAGVSLSWLNRWRLFQLNLTVNLLPVGCFSPCLPSAEKAHGY